MENASSFRLKSSDFLRRFFNKRKPVALRLSTLSIVSAFSFCAIVLGVCVMELPVSAAGESTPATPDVSSPASPDASMSADNVRSWNPKKSLVFVVGVLRWRDKSYAQFTPKARRDAQLVEFFKAQGVPEENIVYLADTEGTLSNIEDKFDDLLERSSENDTLFFYYCGHGWLDNSGVGYYANYDVSTNDNAISTKKIASKLKKNFRGSQALFFADCCSSGSIGLALNKQPGNYAFGMVTSAAPPVSSTSNWTFSQSLLDALNGHKFVDVNLDGQVSFQDLSQYVMQEMKQIDNQVAGVDSGNGFSPNFCLSKVNFPNEVIPRLVEVKVGSRWWKGKLMETRDGQGRIRWVQIGYDTPADDEWRAMESIREIGGGEVNGLAPATTRSDFKVGDSCEVLWKEKFYPAKILEQRDNQYYVHYDGYNASWDEWVGLSRMK